MHKKIILGTLGALLFYTPLTRTDYGEAIIGALAIVGAGIAAGGTFGLTFGYCIKTSMSPEAFEKLQAKEFERLAASKVFLIEQTEKAKEQEEKRKETHKETLFLLEKKEQLLEREEKLLQEQKEFAQKQALHAHA